MNKKCFARACVEMDLVMSEAETVYNSDNADDDLWMDDLMMESDEGEVYIFFWGGVGRMFSLLLL